MTDPDKAEHGPLTGREVSNIIGMHQNSVKRIPVEHLPFFRVGSRGDRRYRPEDVETYIEWRKSGSRPRNALVTQFLDKHNGKIVEAAADMAEQLMTSDPETFKQGYTMGNALIAVMTQFGLDIMEICMVADKIAPTPEEGLDALTRAVEGALADWQNVYVNALHPRTVAEDIAARLADPSPPPNDR